MTPTKTPPQLPELVARWRKEADEIDARGWACNSNSIRARADELEATLAADAGEQQDDYLDALDALWKAHGNDHPLYRMFLAFVNRVRPADAAAGGPTAGDAVFAFSAMLTSLPHVIPLGAAAWATPGADLAAAFNEANGLTVSRDFPKGLRFPEIEGKLLDTVKKAAEEVAPASPPVEGQDDWAQEVSLLRQMAGDSALNTAQRALLHHCADRIHAVRLVKISDLCGPPREMDGFDPCVDCQRLPCICMAPSSPTPPDGRSATLRHPHTGELRDYRDVESDPAGTLCVAPGPLPAYIKAEGQSVEQRAMPDCQDPECGCKDPAFTEPMEALKFLSGRFKYAAVSHAVALSYARDIDAILTAQAQSEAVAEIGPVYTLVWAGTEPVSAIVNRHGLKVGDKLYASPQARGVDHG